MSFGFRRRCGFWSGGFDGYLELAAARGVLIGVFQHLLGLVAGLFVFGWVFVLARCGCVGVVEEASGAAADLGVVGEVLGLPFLEGGLGG